MTNLILCLLLAASPAVVPDVDFRDMQAVARSTAEFRGRVVLLEFWAPWCVPCRKGFPWLDQLAARHQAEGLVVLAITLEQDDASVNAFLKEHTVGFLVGRDPSGRSADQYAVAAMPTSVVLDREGREVARFEGGAESQHAAVEESVIKALAGTAGAPASEGAVSRGKPGARGHLRPWERGFLADPIMNLDGDRLTRSMREHIHASKEAAAGDGGLAGGGCGCN